MLALEEIVQMYTLIFDGSPHKNGDTAALIEAFCAGLSGEIERIRAYDVQGKISACIDCRACWKKPGCAIQDDMQEIYRKIEKADFIVIASPVYYSLLTGPLLSLLSRLQCGYANSRFVGVRMFEKQKLGAVLLVGGGDGRPDPALEAAETLLRCMRAKPVGSAMSLKTDDVSAREDTAALLAAQELAKKLCAAREEKEKDVLKVSAGVICDESGKLLLCRRSYGAQAGQWEFPGGKCESGETYADCLVREIDEELGVRIEVTKELLCMRYAYPDRVIDFAFLKAHIVCGEMDVREHSGIKWVSADQVDAAELCPADACAFAQMKEKLK